MSLAGVGFKACNIQIVSRIGGEMKVFLAGNLL